MNSKKILRKKPEIYLDHASSTPVSLTVLREMEEAQRKYFANPSALHKRGVEVKNLIENARKRIAGVLHAHSDEIIFTASATESDNIALLGVVYEYIKNNSVAFLKKNPPHIIVSSIEHSAVLEAARKLENEGVAVTYLPINTQGIVDVLFLKKSLRPETILVSVMLVNNEIGTIQPIEEISKILRYHRKHIHGINHLSAIPTYPYFHTDAVQAMSYLPLHVEKLGVDMLTLNGSKIYGPKGIGLLYKKRGIKIAPLLFGGEQELMIRPGTENTPAIVGFARAIEEAEKIKTKETTRLSKLQEFMHTLLRKEIPSVIFNGESSKKIVNNVHISIPNFDSEVLVLELDAQGIQASSKSACKSHDESPSYVIMNLRGESYDEQMGNIRFSLGRSTTKKDIIYTVNALRDIIKKYQVWM